MADRTAAHYAPRAATAHVSDDALLAARIHAVVRALERHRPSPAAVSAVTQAYQEAVAELRRG